MVTKKRVPFTREDLKLLAAVYYYLVCHPGSSAVKVDIFLRASNLVDLDLRSGRNYASRGQLSRLLSLGFVEVREGKFNVPTPGLKVSKSSDRSLLAYYAIAPERFEDFLSKLAHHLNFTRKVFVDGAIKQFKNMTFKRIKRVRLLIGLLAEDRSADFNDLFQKARLLDDQFSLSSFKETISELVDRGILQKQSRPGARISAQVILPSLDAAIDFIHQQEDALTREKYKNKVLTLSVDEL